ncbi:MAG: hypothetical protein Q4P25_06160 [Tissierellia bacterium]|nr:hypothetical protein [Tissierellia bacterium]
MKVYKVIVKTMGPVHVGSGEKRNKLNYIWNKGENKIYIPHDTKFMAWIIEKGLIQSFEKYIFGKNSDI